MATKQQLIAAIAAVRGGTANQEQLRWVSDAAKQAGSMGSDARSALQAAGK